MPACCPETITIGAATPWAYPCTWVDSSQVDFLCPGEHLLIDRDAKPGIKPQSGSSIATALAAGLGALLLHITQLVMPERYDHLRKNEVMKAALRKMLDSNKYIYVQQHFHLAFQEDVFWSWEALGREKLRDLVSSVVVGHRFHAVSVADTLLAGSQFCKPLGWEVNMLVSRRLHLLLYGNCSPYI